MSSWIYDREKIQAWLRASYDPSIRVFTKDNWFCKAIAWIIFVLSYIFSFGKKPIAQKDILTGTAMAIGHLHFYPKEWPLSTVWRVAPHEGQHTVQFRWMGLHIHPILGVPLAALVYLLLLFPVGLAFGRLLLEADADREAFREHLYRHKHESPFIFSTQCEHIRRRAESRAKALAGPTYVFSVAYGTSRYVYHKMTEKVIKEAYDNTT